MSSKQLSTRNNVRFDGWSVVHLSTGIAFGWLMNPLVAMAVMTLWEPFEILLLSPILAKRGIDFGNETLRNSLYDIVFNIIGVLLGILLFRQILDPPFQLF